MSDADQAYAAAEARIENAAQSGKDHLSFDDEEFHALTRLPPGIAKLAALTTLDFDNTQIADLAPLAGLTGITSLTLDNTRITDLAPLAGMTGMTSLTFNKTRITDLTPLAGMTGMKGLDLYSTPVADLTPLTGLTEITGLTLQDTRITDLTPLAGMTGITTLRLNNTQITDLTPLAGMTGITQLDLINTQITDLTPLAGMTGITQLLLSGTQITDFTPLAGMTGITTLNLDDTQITDLSHLAGMTRITTLYLDDTQITDLRPLTHLRQLAENPGHFGLTFQNCRAAQRDSRIAEIAEIRNNAERAQTLFDYLNNGWVPPVEAIQPPEDQPAAATIIIPPDGPMHSEDVSPDAADEEQEELRDDLVRKVAQLIEAIGGSNELAGLKSSAEHYSTQIKRPLEELRLRRLYSAANTLRVAYEAEQSAQDQGRVNDYLPPAVAAPLKDVVETHALFFMGLPKAAAIHEQMMSGLTTRRPIGDVTLEAEIVGALDGKDDVLDPEDQAALKDDLAAAEGEGPSAKLGAISLRARIWNMVGAMGRAVYFRAKQIAGIGFAAVVGNWFVTNQATITSWLVSAQGTAAEWFRFAMEYLAKMI